MTTPDQSKGDRSRDEVLAGEYVLGVLGVEERKQVEERLRQDRSFGIIVRRWEDNLSQFNDDYGHEHPPEALFSRIENRIFPPLPQASPWAPLGNLWASLAFWRGLAFACAAAVVVLSGGETGLLGRPAGPPPLVAELAGKDSVISLVARYDQGSGRLQLTPVATGEQRQKSLELWLIEDDAAPRSLGVLPQTGEGELVVPNEMRSLFTEGAILAVSLEPFGGSPTGQATGPVIALGPTHL
ncbi:MULTISPECIES: anti-sigma factor [Alphaproteobacteria]|uniref:Anti-sigma K factor RskA C-terminal domain-containing protein n=2 Tax=Alphaproteobacteria TaxID=28211 RepID=A0A512HDS4_9HYPH|nr:MULTISPECIES: anti-sigma factor [Alphaproteobacteria]GEO83597.1 hypothetical protein RNA01_05290 [Ciceribacter naphthalenivorans]GLR24251.1 hypothetical protein GCM10007920_40450 [Ciceribacter naphthalenivorans]GLT07107.1 hypothetical protein GCM10007926_40450 [Sphingomonas psychrolutea]